MNPAEHASAGHRRRTRDETDADISAACRRLGALALAAERLQQAPPRAEIALTAEGLRRLLAEGRAEP